MINLYDKCCYLATLHTLWYIFNKRYLRSGHVRKWNQNGWIQNWAWSLSKIKKFHSFYFPFSLLLTRRQAAYQSLQETQLLPNQHQHGTISSSYQDISYRPPYLYLLTFLQRRNIYSSHTHTLLFDPKNIYSIASNNWLGSIKTNLCCQYFTVRRWWNIAQNKSESMNNDWQVKRLRRVKRLCQ